MNLLGFWTMMQSGHTISTRFLIAYPLAVNFSALV